MVSIGKGGSYEKVTYVFVAVGFLLFIKPCFAVYWSDFVYDLHDSNGNGLFNGGIDYNGDGHFNGSDQPFTDSVDPAVAVGAPDATFVSLRTGEYISLGFDTPFVDGAGYDLCVVETGASGEVGGVLVSNDGINFDFVGNVHVLSSGTQTQYGNRYWLDLGGLDGPFRYVKITGGEGGESPGFDLSGVGAQNPVPIPGAVWLLGTGLVVILGIRKKRRVAW